MLLKTIFSPMKKTLKMKSKKKYIIDADVFIHFKIGANVLMLFNFLGDSLIISDVVYEELMKNPILKKDFNSFHHIKIEKYIFVIDDDPEVSHNYKKLRGLAKVEEEGHGESSCIAIAMKNKDYVASSNFSDIDAICRSLNIDVISTSELLFKFHKENRLTSEEINQFISRIKRHSIKEKFPFNSFDEIKLKYNGPS